MKKIFKIKNVLRISAGIVALVVLIAALFGSVMMSRANLNKNIEKVGAAATSYAGTSARAMCTLELTSGRILYSKNEEARLPMASTTKIVTAIAAIEAAEEQGLDLDAKVRVHDKAIGIEGTSIYMKRGEELSIRELLYALMLRSGNDAAMAIALAVDKTVEGFCARMETVSKKAGAMNSGFKNPHGLDAEGHFTTAKDLALVTAYALKNPVFAEVVKTTQIRISGPDYPRLLQNKNRLLRQLDGCVGVKTGFTKKAGRCFVGARTVNGMTTVCVVLNCGPMFEETAELLTRSGEEYSMQKLVATDEFVRLTNADAPLVIGCEDFYYPLRDDEIDDVEITLDGNDQATVTFKNKLIYKGKCNKLDS